MNRQENKTYTNSIINTHKVVFPVLYTLLKVSKCVVFIYELPMN